jgi:hypothetical protein
MFKQLARLIERLFAPAFELIGSLPPRAVNRLFMPY